jgi:hypothetical protein|tara:strand:+ start:3904 stop:4482 length:579 start_codon:yes stop_codon:yes gene_type:complete
MASQQNYHTVRYGTAEGEIKFGHITQDNQTSAVMLRNGHHPTHYITLDQTGAPHRKHGTICRSPGSFQVRAGDNTPKDEPGVYVEAVSGDLVLRAPSGRVRIEGQNVDIIAAGYDGLTGIINIDANDKILMRAQTIDASATASLKLFSDNTVNMIAKGILEVYGGLIDFADGACSIKGSKGGSLNEIKNSIL